MVDFEQNNGKGRKTTRKRKDAAGRRSAGAGAGEGRREGSPREHPRSKAPGRSTGEPEAVKSVDRPSAAPPARDDALRFSDLDLPAEMLRAADNLDFRYCTPIQEKLLPAAIEGRDCSGRAQTGTGKTAAFLIALYTRMLRDPRRGRRKPGSPRALILAPTRELARQIEVEALELGKPTPFNVLALYGGEPYEKQFSRLESGPIELVVATPGRLLDCIAKRKVDLGGIETLVIDEADRMLDMGFIPDVRRIIGRTPPRGRRQTMLFSATLTPDVVRLAGQWMKDPVQVEIDPEQVAVESVDQVVYIVTNRKKSALLYNILQADPRQTALVFANRRDTVARLGERLQQFGVSCAVMSGALPQRKREKTLAGFRDGTIRVLVATDVAGRGLHVEGIGRVINYNLPEDPEDYVHRIGRTGRAGAEGTAISFACEADSFYIPDIEEYIGRELRCEHPPPELLTDPPRTDGKSRPRRRSRGRDSARRKR